MVGSWKFLPLAIGWELEVGWNSPQWEGREQTQGSPEGLLLTYQSKEIEAKQQTAQALNSRGWGSSAKLKLSGSQHHVQSSRLCRLLHFKQSSYHVSPGNRGQSAGVHVLATSMEWRRSHSPFSHFGVWIMKCLSQHIKWIKYQCPYIPPLQTNKK